MIDLTDIKILRFLCDDGRVAYSTIAKELNLSDVAVKKRVEKLIAKGVIKRIRAEIDYEKVGYKYVFFMEIKPEPSEISKIYDILKSEPNVLEVHLLIGDYPILLKALAEDISSIKKFLGKVGRMKGVVDVKTVISLKHDTRDSWLPQTSLQARFGR